MISATSLQILGYRSPSIGTQVYLLCGYGSPSIGTPSLLPMWIWIAINRHTESTSYVDMDRHQSAHRVYILCGYGSPSISTPSLLPMCMWIAIIRHTESTSSVDMDRGQSVNRACRYMALDRFNRQTEPANSFQQFNAISRHTEFANVLLSIGSIGKPSLQICFNNGMPSVGTPSLYCLRG